MTPTARATDVRRPIGRAALMLTVGVLASRLWFIFHRGFDLDEFEHAHAAWCVSRGMTPYVDFFEHHTPWLYLLFAPLFPHFNTDTNAASAIALLMVLRLLMWAIAIACVVCVYELGRQWEDRFTGLLAAFFITAASQFQDLTMEFRPDVPALLCFLLTLVAVVRAWKSSRSGAAAAWLVLGGFTFGASVLFTQKMLLAAPGLALALLFYVAGRGHAPGTWRQRAAHVALFALAATTPAAWTAYWFHSHGALDAFLRYNVTFNIGQNAQRFSPFPRLLSHLIHSPALTLLGVGGFVAAIRRARFAAADSRFVLLCTAASLFLGVFVLGRVYDQYLVTYFPHLAVFAAAWTPGLASRLAVPRGDRPWLRPVLILVPFACLGALLLGVDDPGSGKGVAMLAGFTLAAALAVTAVDAWWRARPSRAAGLALTALVAMHYANLARVHQPMGAQLLELAYVTEHTRPGDSVLSATSGPGVFRPHAWYYFFLGGPFVTDRDLAALADDLEAGRMRPQIVVLSEYERKLPPSVWTYVQQRYRRATGDLYELPR